MSAPRFGRLQRVSALVPLMVLSTAWTASLAGAGLTTASAGEEPVQTLPDGTEIPTEAIEAPASVSSPGVVAPGIDGTNVSQVVANASTNGIPSAALAAYQRAETVINSADESCNLSWQLVAAIGRVESDHGRVHGNTLDDDGVAQPGIFGIPLDGRNGTAVITDSDAGQYDSDAEFDRAVGPMQFIPATWSVVGVDADGDAQRNPQDIDDAALAAAVYLCSGRDDLSTEEGQRSSVYRYNHSQSYVDLVLSIMNAYLEGDFTSVPNSTTASAGYFVPAPEPPAPAPTRGPGKGPQGGGGSNDAGPSAPEPAPEPPPEEEPIENDPIDPPGDDGGGGILPDDPDPTKSPTTPPLPDPGDDPVDDVLSPLEAANKCKDQGLDPVLEAAAFDKCVDNLLNP